MSEIAVRDVPERGRYQVSVGGEVAGFVTYHDAGQVRTFLHTEVAAAFEGRGVGSALVHRALDDTRQRGLAVRPACPFVAAWIRRHPDYLDLVVPHARAQVAGG